ADVLVRGWATYRAAHGAAPVLPSGCARSLKMPGEAHPVVSACDALALIPIARAAFSYQPKDLKFVRRTLRNRFPLGRCFRRDLLSTLRDTLRFTFRLPGREALFLVAPWRHQINGGSSRQGKRINPRWRNAWQRAPRAAEQGATAACRPRAGSCDHPLGGPGLSAELRPVRGCP